MLSSQLLPKLFEIIARQYLHIGWLNLRLFLILTQISKNEHLFFRLMVLRDLAPIFWNLNQSEKFSEITPLLLSNMNLYMNCWVLTLISNFQQREKYVVNIYVHLYSSKKITLVFLAKDSTKNRFVLRSIRLSKWKNWIEAISFPTHLLYSQFVSKLKHKISFPFLNISLF